MTNNRTLDQHRERILGALDGTIQRVPLHRLATGFADQAQQFTARSRFCDVVAPASW